MTLSTSAVAVCCCNDSRNSLSNRAFSMAMTAWSAKVLTSSICCSVKGSTRCRERLITPIGSASRISGTPSKVLVLATVNDSGTLYSWSDARSAICNARLSSSTRPVIESRPMTNRRASDGFLEVDSVRHGLGCGTDCRHIAEPVAVAARDERHFSRAQPRRRFSESGEHGLEVESRMTDQLEHVSSSSLLLE